MPDKLICPLCSGEVPEPVDGNTIDIRGVAAYWIASLHEQTKRLEAMEKESGEPAVREQIRRNVEIIHDLLALW